MQVKNYLLGYEGMYIYQDTEMFNFSIDSVLLPNFVTINKNIKNILDIGCGNAPIPLILSTRTSANIVGVEIQNESYLLAKKSVAENKLENQIKIINDDILNYYKEQETETYDIITCNPPFFNSSNSKQHNISTYKKIARHEVSLNLEDIFKVSKKLLKNKGVLAIVHRPDRLIEILEGMRKHNLQPKKIQFVYPKKDKDSNILLVEATKNGNPGVKIMPPIYIHNSDGSYTNQIKQFFKNN